MKRWRGERGQASTVLIIAVPALLFVALVIIGVAGDGILKRSQTGTAADAAALGAAEEWRSYVAGAIDSADGVDADVALARLRGLLTTDVPVIDQGPVNDRARQLAQANGATVTNLKVRLTARGLEFAVSTRSNDEVAHTSTRAEADATAVVELDHGACWKGARLGLVHDGDCLAWSDLHDALTPTPPDGDGDGDPTASPSPSPTPAPKASWSFRAHARLSG